MDMLSLSYMILYGLTDPSKVPPNHLQISDIFDIEILQNEYLPLYYIFQANSTTKSN